jgi:2-(1,2-epoxy-1,2-dihydrophenyl)acetyl-CoA isomerase
MTGAPVLLDIADGVARLTLNRPDAANAIDLKLARALAEAVGEVVEEPAVRAVLITGNGPRFCGGGDVHSFADSGEELGECLEEIVTPLHVAVNDLARLDAPVVVAVQGSAAGAGLSIVAGADLALAGASAKFVMAYTGIGFSPDGGATWFLPRRIGTGRALELTLTNRVLSAEEACDWGLVSRVVPDEALGAEADALVRALANGPTRAFGAVKRLFQASLNTTLEAQLAHEATELVMNGERDDGREGVAAFVAKRRPVFRGE